MNIKPFTTFISSHFAKILSVFFFILLSAAYVQTFAVFAPGESLSPNCQPGDAGCYVQTSGGSVAWGSITGAPTALTAFTNDAGYVTASGARTALLGMYEVPLTFSTGLSRSTNTITNNLSTGISGGQSVIGGTASGNNLTLSSTSNATKGKILFGTSAYDEVNNRLGVGDTTPTQNIGLAPTGKYGIGDTQVLYLPDQSSLSGTLIVGNGGGNLLHTYSSEGQFNTIVGIGSANSLTSGNRNTAVGYQTLANATTAIANVAIGSNVLMADTEGGSNVGVGQNSLFSNTTGYGNVGIGTQTLQSNDIGCDNTALGEVSLVFLHGNYCGNTALGNTALYHLQSGGRNIAIGYSTASNQISGSNNIAIGSGVNLPDVNASDQLNIGNIIYGNLSTGTIGIGVSSFTSESERLNILGAIKTTATVASVSAPTNLNVSQTCVSGCNYIATGKIHNWRIYSYKRVNNIKYYSNDYLTLPSNFSDNGLGGNYDISISWSPVSGVDGYRVLKFNQNSNNYDTGYDVDDGEGGTPPNSFVDDNCGTTCFASGGIGVEPISGAAANFNGTIIASDNLLFKGLNRYINFNSLASGNLGYGIRDNSGSIEYKNNGGSWTALSSLGGSISVGGSTGQIQYNDSGVLTADANFSWDAITKVLGVMGSIVMKDTDTSNVSINTGTKSFVSGLTDTGNGSYIDIGSSRSLVLASVFTGGNINISDSQSIVVGQAFSGGNLSSGNNNSFTMGTAVSGGSLYGGPNSITMGYADTGAQIYTSGGSSITFGVSSGAGSQLYSGNASFTFGTAYSGGKIHGDGDGSLVFGSAQGDPTAELYAGNFSLVFGYAQDANSKIYSNSDTSLVFGSAINGAVLHAGGSSSMVFGYVSDSGSYITAGQSGQAFGIVNGGGHISADNSASLVYGQALNGGVISSTGGSGTLMFGYSDGVDSLIDTQYDAAAAFGYTHAGGKILGNGNGSFAFGYAESTGSQIYTQNSGTLTFGKVDTSGVISGQGGGSLVFGSSEGSGNIYSSGDATLVFGYANGHGGNANYITSGNALGKGSITFGYSDSSVFAGHVESDGRGAFAGGYVQSGDIISVGDGSFAYGDNVMVNDANEYIFGQNGEISLGGDGNSFLIALGGGTRTMLTSNMTFAVGADGMLVLNVDAGSQVATVTGGTTHPFIVATAGGNTCTFDTVSGTFSCPSDFRLKHNITSLDTSAVSKIMSLNPVTFNYNWQKEGDAVIPGFIAQDFETVFPSMVTTDAKTGYKSLSYTPLIPYAIKAIQEMNLRVQSFIPDAMDASGYAKLKVFFAGIVQRGELLIDSVITKKVTSDEINTKKLCIDDVCVTKEQLQQVLNNQNISLPSVESQPVIDSQQVQATIPVEVPPNTSTPEILNHVVPEAAETVPIVDIPSTSQ